MRLERRRIGAMRVLREHVEAAAAASVRPPEAERFLEFGPNPFRGLVLGSGSAVGYGVERRRDALDGRLGTRVAAALGRGVVVSNVARHDSTLADQLLLARVAIDYGSADLVVWCPSFVEFAGRVPARVWKTRLTELVSLTVSPAVVILELPTPEGDHEAAAIAAPIIGRINTRLRRIVRRAGGVVTVTPPPVHVRELGEPLFDADYYDRLGAAVAAAALPLVQRPRVPSRAVSA